MKFRFKALEKRRQPDQLDSPMLLAAPRGWVAVFTVLIVTVMIGLWGFLGAVPRAAAVDGMLAYPKGIADLESHSAGTVTDVLASGMQVRRGQAVATIRTPSGSTSNVMAPSAGRIVSVTHRAGDYVRPGDAVVQLEQIDSPTEPLQVQLVASGDKVPFIRPGQKVTLAVPGINPRAFGRLKGQVTHVSPYPVTGGDLDALSGEKSTAPGTSHLVTVQLQRDSRTVSGYAWTSASGPPTRLTSRTPVSGEIALGSIAPITMLIGS